MRLFYAGESSRIVALDTRRPVLPWAIVCYLRVGYFLKEPDLARRLSLYSGISHDFGRVMMSVYLDDENIRVMEP